MLNVDNALFWTFNISKSIKILTTLVWICHMFLLEANCWANCTSPNRVFSRSYWSCLRKGINTKVCSHCFNSSVFVSPFSFPECGWHRNPSKAFYQAFQSGSRLRDSKAHSDRYSTVLDWTGTGLQECNNMCAVFSSSKLLLSSTCMDWVWRESLAASARLANRLLNNISFSLSFCFWCLHRHFLF